MAERECLFLQANDYDAIDLRTASAAVLGGRNFESITPATGMIGRGHGVLSGDAMLVTASPTPDNEVHVAPGICAIRGSQANNQGVYICPLDAEATLTIPAKHASLTTVHYVVAQVKDSFYAAHTGDVWALEVVSADPGAGNPTVPEDALVLARVTVPGGTSPPSTIVTNSMITDFRPHARATGGITPVAVRGDFPAPQAGDVIWEWSTSTLLIRSTTGTWLTIGKNLDASWTTYTPVFCGGALQIGNGSVYGRYTRFGRTVIGVCGFDLGTTGNIPSGAGGITATIPVAAYNPGSNVRYMAFGRAFIGGAFYSCTAEINPSFSPTLIFNFATAGLPSWNETNPANWGTPGAGDGQLRVEFVYEAA
jgi:hypothetical protein